VRDRSTLVRLALAGLALAAGGCRSPRIAPAPSSTQPADPAEVAAFSELVDELTRIGSHGAIDPRKEREQEPPPHRWPDRPPRTARSHGRRGGPPGGSR
jgi:hypothetical protein